MTGEPPEVEHGLPRFKMTDEEVIHESFVFTVTKATFVDPDGSSFERDIIRHPGAVAIVALTDDERVVLVRQFRAPLDRWILEVPAGTCDVVGEAQLDAAHRELAEEVGYAARELTLLTRCAITPGFCDELSSVYLATGLMPVPLDRQGIEEAFMEVVEIPLADFDDLVDEGVIIDATTILGVGLARRRLARSVNDRS